MPEIFGKLLLAAGIASVPAGAPRGGWRGRAAGGPPGSPGPPRRAPWSAIRPKPGFGATRAGSAGPMPGPRRRASGSGCGRARAGEAMQDYGRIAMRWDGLRGRRAGGPRPLHPLPPGAASSSRRIELGGRARRTEAMKFNTFTSVGLNSFVDMQTDLLDKGTLPAKADPDPDGDGGLRTWRARRSRPPGSPAPSSWPLAKAMVCQAGRQVDATFRAAGRAIPESTSGRARNPSMPCWAIGPRPARRSRGRAPATTPQRQSPLRSANGREGQPVGPRPPIGSAIRRAHDGVISADPERRKSGVCRTQEVEPAQITEGRPPRELTFDSD